MNFLLHTELQNTEVGSVIIRTNAYQHFRAFFFFFFFPPNIAGSHTFFFLLFRKIFSQYIYFHVYMHLHWKAYIICVQPLLQGAAGGAPGPMTAAPRAPREQEDNDPTLAFWCLSWELEVLHVGSSRVISLGG